MKVILCLAALACFVAVAYCGTASGEFVKYVEKYNKKYSDNAEFHRRFANYRASKARIARLNTQAAASGLNTKFGINEFSDMSPEEFKGKYMGYQPSGKKVEIPEFVDTGSMQLEAIPKSFDWRSKGAVTAVKNQEQCGSCWAFSTTEGVESAWFMAGHPLPNLAPQQIVDCDNNDDGCDGGDLPTAFQYVKQYGLEKASAYPYTAEDGTCNYNKAAVVAKITGFQYATQSGNETKMQLASLVHGPLSICVDAETWQDYTSGVITHNCGNSLDHCVQIVGWDVTSDGQNIPYWIIRNSWGTSWGLQGYLWVERNKNECGVSDEATYALAPK